LEIRVCRFKQISLMGQYPRRPHQRRAGYGEPHVLGAHFVVRLPAT
jgi:hypothetical protein